LELSTKSGGSQAQQAGRLLKQERSFISAVASVCPQNSPLGGWALFGSPARQGVAAVPCTAEK